MIFMMKREIFKVEGDKVTRLRRHCPKCGSGVFLADHKDRLSCGTCGYTEYKSAGNKQPEKPAASEKMPAHHEKKPEKQETKENKQ